MLLVNCYRDSPTSYAQQYLWKQSNLCTRPLWSWRLTCTHIWGRLCVLLIYVCSIELNIEARSWRLKDKNIYDLETIWQQPARAQFRSMFTKFILHEIHIPAKTPFGGSRGFSEWLREDTFRRWRRAHEKGVGHHADASDEATADRWRCVY